MSAAVVVMALGAFFAGGAISFAQQHKAAWAVVLMALIAALLIGYGWYTWFQAR